MHVLECKNRLWVDLFQALLDTHKCLVDLLLKDLVLISNLWWDLFRLMWPGVLIDFLKFSAYCKNCSSDGLSDLVAASEGVTQHEITKLMCKY